MKIHNKKLTKKNFWFPFVLFSLLSFIGLALAILSSIYLAQLPIFIQNNAGISFFYFVFQSLELIISFRLPLLIFSMIVVFFFLRRLSSPNTKRLFYLELPILIFLSYLANSFLGGMLMLGGAGIYTVFSFLFPVVFWLTALAISLYFYYKKFVNKKK